MSRQTTRKPLAANAEACPVCGAALAVDATRPQGSVRVVYRTCTADPSHRYRSDERSDPAAAYCPTCRRPVAPHCTDSYARRYHCGACGRVFVLPLVKEASA